MRELTARIKEAAISRLRNAGEGKPSVQEVRASIDAAQSTTIKEATQILKGGISRAQRAFDSPEEYTRFYNACDGQVYSLIKQAGF